MELDAFGLVAEYGLPLVLLLGAIYALYKFMVFSLYEVKMSLVKGMKKMHRLTRTSK